MGTNLIGWHLLNCMFFVSFTVFNYSLIKIYLFSWIHSYSSKHVNKMKQLIANTVAKWWHINWYFYRPQRSCGQGNVFTGVCLSTGGEGVCLSACWDAIPPSPTRQTPPQDQADPSGPGRPLLDQADTPPGRHPPGPGRPPRPGRHPPGTRQTPPSGSRLQHTVYERPVRILLECILVLFNLERTTCRFVVNISTPICCLVYDNRNNDLLVLFEIVHLGNFPFSGNFIQSVNL